MVNTYILQQIHWSNEVNSRAEHYAKKFNFKLIMASKS